MGIGPFDLDRPLVENGEGPLGADRPLVQPERASIVEHVATRDSAAVVAYEMQLRDKWAEERLQELRMDLQNARERRSRLERKYERTPIGYHREMIADDIMKTEARIDEIQENIEEVQNGEVQPGPYSRSGDPKKMPLAAIQRHLPEVLYEAVSDIGVTDEPDVLAKAQDVIIQTDVSTLTMDEVRAITETYEDLGLHIKRINFR